MEGQTQPGRNGGTLKKGGTKGPGRPTKLPSLDLVMANVLGDEQQGITAAEAIVRALFKSALKGNVQAIKLLLERGYGMPKQPIEHSGKDGEPLAPTVIKVEYRKPDSET